MFCRKRTVINEMEFHNRSNRFLKPLGLYMGKARDAMEENVRKWIRLEFLS